MGRRTTHIVVCGVSAKLPPIKKHITEHTTTDDGISITMRRYPGGRWTMRWSVVGQRFATLEVEGRTRAQAVARLESKVRWLHSKTAWAPEDVSPAAMEVARALVDRIQERVLTAIDDALRDVENG